jgi:hypothetical protein
MNYVGKLLSYKILRLNIGGHDCGKLEFTLANSKTIVKDLRCSTSSTLAPASASDGRFGRVARLVNGFAFVVDNHDLSKIEFLNGALDF